MFFKENLRKRQSDIFLDSWRKVTCRLNLSYQFKCKSRQQFFNIFTDTFQNCIEEIGLNSNTSQSSEILNNSSVHHFRDKMISTFEMCKLWPLNYEDYKEHFENMQKLTSKNGKTGEETVKQNGDYYLEEEDNEEEEAEGEENDENETGDESHCDESVDEEDDIYKPTSKRQKLSSKPTPLSNSRSLSNGNSTTNKKVSLPNSPVKKISHNSKPAESDSHELEPSKTKEKYDDLSLVDCINASSAIQQCIRKIITSTLVSELNSIEMKNNTPAQADPVGSNDNTFEVVNGHHHNQSFYSREMVRDFFLGVLTSAQTGDIVSSSKVTSYRFNDDKDVEEMFDLLTRTCKTNQELMNNIILQFVSNRKLHKSNTSMVIDKLIDLLYKFYST